MNCTVCGAEDPTEHEVARGFIVFCCRDCVPVIQDLRNSYRSDAQPDAAAS